MVKDDILRQVLGDRPVMGGIRYIAAVIESPGVIAHTGTMARMVFGEYDGSSSARAVALLEACQRAGVDAELSPDIRRSIWEKFVLIAGFNGTTAAVRARIGPIRANPQARAFLLDAMREAVAVGRALGVDLPPDYAEARLAFCDSLPAEMTSSTLTDLEQGNRLETPWLSGVVVELGQKAGIPTPVQPGDQRHPGRPRRGAGRRAGLAGRAGIDREAAGDPARAEIAAEQALADREHLGETLRSQ